MAGARMTPRSCGICEVVNQPSVCAACVNLSLREKRKVLNRLMQKRDQLRDQLGTKLMLIREAGRQRHFRLDHSERCDCFSKAINQLGEQLHRARLDLGRKEEIINARATRLSEAQSKLAAKRAELLVQAYPDILRAHSLGLTVVASELSQVRRYFLKCLQTILPLRLPIMDGSTTAWDGRRMLANCLYICEQRLPGEEDLQCVPQAELSAALGYMVLLVNLVSRYLGAPLLHQAGFAASSSRIWQRASYWDSRPAARGMEHPLFLPRNINAEELSAAAYELSPSRADSSGRICGQGVDILARPMSAPPHHEGDRSSGSQSGRAGMQPLAPRTSRYSMGAVEGVPPAHVEPLRHSDGSAVYREVRKGMAMLRRSVACINAYESAVPGIRTWEHQPQFSAFAVMLSVLRDGGSQLGVPSGTDISRVHMPGAKGEGVAGAPRTGQGLEGASGQEPCTKDDPEDDPEVGEWKFVLIKPPFLPPPPSSGTDDIEHWWRAMSLDAT
ncbi:hypothetical protein CBR_g4197 [Chara braunii]|uniref:UV radiation resistance protein/autophagy-related protein 14 n=1 Tax=Chara braunii TaxID=69332 RepID=A0A388KHF7_CHABU|nr:hypothetical protein CBR_g4197 [Chara braunii]|eukprot:GBG69504.1 hypothetical protein CBR_g4197 [Chara braunii]